MTDALHPQTFLAYGMHGGERPVRNGGPLRLRLPRQLGYKSVKRVWAPRLRKEAYAWYAGI